jgi:hypothetical protein
MRLPAFTAEAACDRTVLGYRRPRAAGRHDPGEIVPATTYVLGMDNTVWCCDPCGTNPDGTHMMCCDPCATGPGVSTGTAPILVYQ